LALPYLSAITKILALVGAHACSENGQKWFYRKTLANKPFKFQNATSDYGNHNHLQDNYCSRSFGFLGIWVRKSIGKS
jgi:hypothetical protein